MDPRPVESLTPAYRAVVAVATPVMRWSRLAVTGLDCLPPTGPVLVIANHDSYWDPLAIAVAARRVRQIRAFAKSTLWKTRIVAKILDGMGQIPIDRGKANTEAIDIAVRALRSGACIGVFPEGTRSRGRTLKAHSGAGRLALAVPETTIVCARVTGTTDVVRVPKRPRITVDFFLPAGGQLRQGERSLPLMKRVLAELRDGAPPAEAGRRRGSAKSTGSS
jgi:1-acyl-sn-glycerol-3-phosphate acyltransferase